MSWFDTVIASLALWRIASLFTAERGPGRMFVLLRGRVGVLHDDNDKPIGFDESRAFAEAFYCLWCFSMWAGLPYGALWVIVPGIMLPLSMPFALSTLAVVIERYINHG